MAGVPGITMGYETNFSMGKYIWKLEFYVAIG